MYITIFWEYILQYIYIYIGWWLSPTPVKNDGVD